MTTEDERRKQVFALVVGSEGGFDYTGVEQMTVRDRLGYLELLAEQKKRERAEVDKIKAESKMRRANSRS